MNRRSDGSKHCLRDQTAHRAPACQDPARGRPEGGRSSGCCRAARNPTADGHAPHAHLTEASTAQELVEPPHQPRREARRRDPSIGGAAVAASATRAPASTHRPGARPAPHPRRQRRLHCQSSRARRHLHPGSLHLRVSRLVGCSEAKAANQPGGCANSLPRCYPHRSVLALGHVRRCPCCCCCCCCCCAASDA